MRRKQIAFDLDTKMLEKYYPTPAVEINIKKSSDHGDIKYQKIHFVKG